jgi:hypothetical protein
VPGDCGYVLHAMRVRLEHPVTRARLLLEALPIPLALQTPAERTHRTGLENADVS